MIHNHHQCGCNHSVKYCACCDVVYCTKCGKEWRCYGAYTYTSGSYLLNACPTSPTGITAGLNITYSATPGTDHSKHNAG